MTVVLWLARIDRRFYAALPAHIGDDGVPGGAQVFKYIPDSFQVIQRDIVTNILVWSQQNGAALGGLNLQRTDPGIEIFRRELTLQMFQAGLPVFLGHSGSLSLSCCGIAFELCLQARMDKSNPLWIT